MLSIVCITVNRFQLQNSLNKYLMLWWTEYCTPSQPQIFGLKMIFGSLWNKCIVNYVDCRQDQSYRFTSRCRFTALLYGPYINLKHLHPFFHFRYAILYLILILISLIFFLGCLCRRFNYVQALKIWICISAFQEYVYTW